MDAGDILTIVFSAVMLFCIVIAITLIMTYRKQAAKSKSALTFDNEEHERKKQEAEMAKADGAKAEAVKTADKEIATFEEASNKADVSQEVAPEIQEVAPEIQPNDGDNK